MYNVGKFLCILETQKNGAPSYYNHGGPHHEFNEWTPQLIV